MHALLVEDDDRMAQALATALARRGHTVRRVGRALDALRHARVADLVLLDLGLPDMDGHEVARTLLADPRHAGVVLVALTGWGAEQDRTRTANAGFGHHLTKPIDPDRLQVFLDNVFLGLPESPA